MSLAHGADAQLKRLPSAFDVNVLLLVLAYAQIQRNPVVTFPSRAEILHSLGLHMNREHVRARVDAALDLWSVLTMQMPWHPDHKKTMPPPIEVPCREGNSFAVTVNVDWRGLGKEGYFKQVPMPLPHDAATQNLVLYLLTCVSKKFDCDGKIMRRTSPQNRVGLSRKMGLTNSASYRAFSRTCFEADKWLRKHGGALVKWDIQEKNVIFDIKDPKIKHSKAQVGEQNETTSEETRTLMERMSRPLAEDKYRGGERWISVPDDF